MATTTSADRIAETALCHYHHNLPSQKGKPQANEWTVYAAIVAELKTENASPSAAAAISDCTPLHNDGGKRNDDNSAHSAVPSSSGGGTRGLSSISSSSDAPPPPPPSLLWVVSCATGTKCTAQRRHVGGRILHDCHAEVLARRGLVHVLWHEIIRSMERSIEKKKENQQQEPYDTNDYDNAIKPINNPLDRMLLQRIFPDTDDVQTTTQIQQDRKMPHPPQFMQRPNIRLHMYISDAPCGDASIYPIMGVADTPAVANPVAKDFALQFTGAKVIVSDQTGVTLDACGGKQQQLRLMMNNGNHINNNINNNSMHHNGTSSTTATVARERDQLLGKLRSKSGRSNLRPDQRSHSMSCSDKLVRWSILGLQGAVLSTRWIQQPIVLSSIVVSHDPRNPIVNADNNFSCCETMAFQRQALDRALVKRVQDVKRTLEACNDDEAILFCLPHVLISNQSNQQPSSNFRAIQNHQDCSIVTSDDYDNNHTSAAIIQGIRDYATHRIELPQVFVVSVTFHRSKAVTEAVIANPTTSTIIQYPTFRKRKYTESDSNNARNPSNTRQTISEPRTLVADHPSTAATAVKARSETIRQINDVKGSSAPSRKKASPTGLSIVWYQGMHCCALSTMTKTCHKNDSTSFVEVIVGARGIKQGKMPRTDHDYEQLQSSLSRATMVELANVANETSRCLSTWSANKTLLSEPESIDPLLHHNEKQTDSTVMNSTSYQDWKRQHLDSVPPRLFATVYRAVRRIIFQKGPLSGWLVGGIESSHNNDPVLPT